MSQPLFFIYKKKHRLSSSILPMVSAELPLAGLDILVWLGHPAGELQSSVYTALLCWMNVVGVIWDLLSPGNEWHRNVFPFVVASFEGQSTWHLGVTLNEWKWGKGSGDLQWEICLAVYDYYFHFLQWKMRLLLLCWTNFWTLGKAWKVWLALLHYCSNMSIPLFFNTAVSAGKICVPFTTSEVLSEESNEFWYFSNSSVLW